MYILMLKKIEYNFTYVVFLFCIAKPFPNTGFVYILITTTSGLPTTQHLANLYSTKVNKIATYEDVKAVGGNTKLIDVREPSELKETGILPKSYNIPLGEIEQAFKSRPEEFKRKYGFAKPELDSPIVFSCKAGIRSEKALNIIEKIGYENVRNYKGGWMDWEEQCKK